MDMEYNRLVHFLQEGSIALPVALLKNYRKLGLSEKEVMLLIQLIVFQEKEHKSFPTMDEIQQRMTLTLDELTQSIQLLVHRGFLLIEHEVNEEGLHCESYSLAPLFSKLADLLLEETQQEEETEEANYRNVFQLFEQEFGRPLSPWECETLAQWIDVDGYKEELIEAALREAVYCGKPNIRYIDRILLEWSQKQIQTAHQAAEYSKKFRQKGILYQSIDHKVKAKPAFSIYNWVNQE
jgi:DNA replication protein